MNSLLKKLKGGDLRSIGKVNSVVKEALKKGGKISELMDGLFGEDPIIRMRSADAIEKISKANPELVQEFKAKFLSLLSKAKQNEVKWHLAQIVPRLKLSPQEMKKSARVFKSWVTSSEKSQIVRVSAMQALFELEGDLEWFKLRLKDQSAAVRARARKLLKVKTHLK